MHVCSCWASLWHMGTTSQCKFHIYSLALTPQIGVRYAHVKTGRNATMTTFPVFTLIFWTLLPMLLSKSVKTSFSFSFPASLPGQQKYYLPCNYYFLLVLPQTMRLIHQVFSSFPVKQCDFVYAWFLFCRLGLVLLLCATNWAQVHHLYQQLRFSTFIFPIQPSDYITSFNKAVLMHIFDSTSILTGIYLQSKLASWSSGSHTNCFSEAHICTAVTHIHTSTEHVW